MKDLNVIFTLSDAVGLFGGFDYSKTQILQRGLFDAFTEGSQEWIVLKDCYFWSHRFQIMIKTPKSFITDFASIPRLARFLFTGQGKTRYPALPHDIMYAFAHTDLINLSRRDADLILMDMCESVGMKKVAYKAVYYAVRTGGFKPWNSDKKIQFATPDIVDKYTNYHPELSA